MPPDGKGLKSEDFRKRAQVETLRKSTALAPTDPMVDAMAFKRQLAAAKLTDQAITAMDADALRSENDRLAEEIKQRQLTESLKGKDSESTNAWQEYILRQLEQTQGALMASQQALTDVQTASMQQQISMLHDELARIGSVAPVPVAPPVNPVESLTESIRQANDLKELLETLAPTTKGIAASEPVIALRLKLAELEHERWKADRADQHAEKMAGIQLSNALAREQIGIERERAAKMDRFVNDTAPKILDIVQQVATRFLNGQPVVGAAAQAEAVAAAADARADAVQPKLPPGAASAECGVCGATIVYRPEWPGVICPGCHSEYTGLAATEQQQPAGAAPGRGTSNTNGSYHDDMDYLGGMT